MAIFAEVTENECINEHVYSHKAAQKKRKKTAQKHNDMHLRDNEYIQLGAQQ